MNSHKSLLLMFPLLIAPACAYEEDDGEFRSAPDTGSNTAGGTVFNTNELDDMRFSEISSGIQPNAVQMPGFRLHSLQLKQGSTIHDLSVHAGELYGVDDQQELHTGVDFLLSTWSLVNPEFKDIPVMSLVGTKVQDGVPRYAFAYHGKDGGLVPTCPPSSNLAGWARLLDGFSLNEKTGEVTNSPSTTYFACNTGATGKAADLGFYDLVLDHIGLYPTDRWLPFELAIRVLRADYCYDGNSHTKAGTAVWIEDTWGVLDPPAQKNSQTIEAIWGADGLICQGVGRQQPIDCPKTDSIPQCKPGDTLDSYPGALFRTRLIGLTDPKVPKLVDGGEIELVELP